MKTLAIIPARYASTRFPGKPLAVLGNKPVIQHVWERVLSSSSITDAVIATDDLRIAESAERFGGRAMLTSSHHRSGTDRCGEVVQNLEEAGKRYDTVINIQGDEPFIHPRQIDLLADCFENETTTIATLRKAIEDPEILFNPNNVKVVTDNNGYALYFSREPIPHLRGTERQEWTARHAYYKHIGIYAFRTEVLKSIIKMPPSTLEQCESLEQLRWLENGHKIMVPETDIESIGIDTPEDLQRAEQFMLSEKTSQKQL